jgi:prephenate dehydrogenase
MSRVVVFGAAGVVGRWARRHLAGDQDQVATVDLTGEVDHRADARAPDAKTRAAVAAADLVALALPEDVAAACIDWLPDAAPARAVVLSTCSVQRPLFDRSAKAGMPQLLIGANPMFSPTLPAAGRPVVVVAREQRDEVAAVRDRLAAAGMSVTVMTPDEHDAAMSYLQVLPHAAVLSFAGALAQAPVDVETLMAMAPPPARTLIALACRMVTAPPEVYWDIQHANPDGEQRRRELRAAIARLDTLVVAGRSADFQAALSAAADWLGPHLGVGADECRTLFHYLQERT